MILLYTANKFGDNDRKYVWYLLALHQPQRIIQMPEIAIKVGQIIDALESMGDGEADIFPFDIILQDPAGNSFIQNPFAPQIDPNMKV